MLANSCALHRHPQFAIYSQSYPMILISSYNFNYCFLIFSVSSNHLFCYIYLACCLVFLKCHFQINLCFSVYDFHILIICLFFHFDFYAMKNNSYFEDFKENFLEIFCKIIFIFL